MAEPAESVRLTAARAGDQGEFRALTERYRRELIVHCYRFVGNVDDAEDVVQEVMLRAWLNLAKFEGRSSLRTWLYSVATHASLDAIERRGTRVLPRDTHAAAVATAPLLPPAMDVAWLGPLPDAMLPEGTETNHALRESVGLAFLAALQRLPPRQRAALILCDVVEWQVSEVAELLDLTVAAVTSLLARARAALKERYSRAPAPPSDDQRVLLGRYVRAWEGGDVGALVALMKEDATMMMPPVPSWYEGRASIHDFIRASIFGRPGAAARLLPVGSNGQPAFAFYCRADGAAPFTLLGVQVVSLEDAAIAGLITFVGPDVAARFALPHTLA